MKVRRFFQTGSISGIALLFGAGMLTAAPPANNSAKIADKLLSDVRMDATHAAMHARRFERLAREHAPTWQSYDKQWNEIKPPVEDMSVKLVRLERMRASLTQRQQSLLDQSKTLIERISGNTHALRALLNQPAKDLTSPAFHSESANLAKDARDLEQLLAKA